MKHYILMYLLCLISTLMWSIIHAQTKQTKQVLTPGALILQIRQHHPVAKQANLISEKAAADLLSAKGGFDPVFEMNTSSKSLDGTNYYRYNNPELKVPTLIGVDLKTGFENSKGQYQNPEYTKGVASYIGVEIKLLNGLLMDKRRAALQQAKIYQNQSEQERLVIINDLLYNAYMAYWQWAGAYQLFKVYSKYVAVADKRVRLVTLSFLNGDRAMADTIEAYTQLQNYKLLEAEALMQLKTQAFNLSGYLWNSDGNPYLLPSDYIPDTAQFEMIRPIKNVEELVKQVQVIHPQLKTYQYKLKDLEVERSLKIQDLLPVVNVKANVLSKDYYVYKRLDAAYLENNYKLGVVIKIPLLLRQGRGEYKKAQLKIKDVDLQLSEKEWQFQNKIRIYHNEASLLQGQLQIAISMYSNLVFLLRNEELKFSQGESSLFLINSRENKVLEMQQKLIELQMKYQKAVYAIDWASGIIE